MPYKNLEDIKRYRDAHKEKMRVYSKEYRESHPEQMAQYKRDWTKKIGPQNITARRREYHRVRYENNKEHHLALGKEYRRNNSDKVYEKEIKRKFGWTLADKKACWLSQDKKCKICRCDIGLRSSHIDHIHGSNPIIIRGLLCVNCNIGIGNFMDDPIRLRAAADYLSQFPYPTLEDDRVQIAP